MKMESQIRAPYCSLKEGKGSSSGHVVSPTRQALQGKQYDTLSLEKASLHNNPLCHGGDRGT